MKSPEDMRQQQSEQESQPSGGIGGRLLGGLAKKMAQKKAAQSDAANRTMVMTLDAEVLSVTTSVAASDVAVPAGFQVK